MNIILIPLLIILICVIVYISFHFISGASKYFNSNEHFSSLAPITERLDDSLFTITPPKLNGYTFFDASYPITKMVGGSSPGFKSLNNYCIYSEDRSDSEGRNDNEGPGDNEGRSDNEEISTSASADICDFENKNEIILPQDLEADHNTNIPSFLKSFTGKKIGILENRSNSEFGEYGSYGMSNEKLMTKTMNPGMSGSTSNLGIPGDSKSQNQSVLNQRLDNTSSSNDTTITIVAGESGNNQESQFPDTGYSEYLKGLFVDSINENGGKFKFIGLNKGNVTINTKPDNSKMFIIPFFIYEYTFNYTRGIVVTFLITSTRDIIVNEVLATQLTPSKGWLNLKPVTLYRTFTDPPILDTNGYFQIKNPLGLFYPFKTSKEPRPNPADFKKWVSSESEGAKITSTDYLLKIKNFI